MRCERRSTPRRLRSGEHNTFIVLNPLSASADVTGNVSIAKLIAVRFSGLHEPLDSTKSLNPLRALLKSAPRRSVFSARPRLQARVQLHPVVTIVH
jgi:hypothetical protein